MTISLKYNRKYRKTNQLITSNKTQHEEDLIAHTGSKLTPDDGEQLIRTPNTFPAFNKLGFTCLLTKKTPKEYRQRPFEHLWQTNEMNNMDHGCLCSGNVLALPTFAAFTILI